LSRTQQKPRSRKENPQAKPLDTGQLDGIVGSLRSKAEGKREGKREGGREITQGEWNKNAAVVCLL
jgi:hypothetical protein